MTAAETVNWLPSLLVWTTDVVTVLGAVIVARSAKVAFDQCSVTPPTTRVVSDWAVLSKASVIEA